jgi:uncharacterized protein (TIGR02271 family)
MTTTNAATWNDWIGATVVDRDGDKIGTLESVYMDRGSGQPEWLAVKTGLFGTKQSFVPIGEAQARGDDLQVPFEKAHVKDAPNVDPEEGYLTGEEEGRLYQHYGREYQDWSDEEQDLAGDEWAEPNDVTRSGGDTGEDTSGRNTDDAMTRSEEELKVGTRSQEAGRVRLRKYVVTENVTTTVPVRKEKARIEREPITDANVDQATSGPDISDEEHEMVLNEEEVVTEKRTVPKERVRVDKDVETEQREVSGDVRKERIDVEGDVDQAS